MVPISKKGCFSCILRDNCKISQILSDIHEKYSSFVMGIELLGLADEWCGFKERLK